MNDSVPAGYQANEVNARISDVQVISFLVQEEASTYNKSLYLSYQLKYNKKLTNATAARETYAMDIISLNGVCLLTDIQGSTKSTKQVIVCRPHFSSSRNMSEMILYPGPSSWWKAKSPLLTLSRPWCRDMKLLGFPEGLIFWVYIACRRGSEAVWKRTDGYSSGGE